MVADAFTVTPGCLVKWPQRRIPPLTSCFKPRFMIKKITNKNLFLVFLHKQYKGPVTPATDTTQISIYQNLKENNILHHLVVLNINNRLFFSKIISILSVWVWRENLFAWMCYLKSFTPATWDRKTMQCFISSGCVVFLKKFPKSISKSDSTYFRALYRHHVKGQKVKEADVSLLYQFWAY